jgi:hypothetical protein
MLPVNRNTQRLALTHGFALLTLLLCLLFVWVLVVVLQETLVVEIEDLVRAVV